MKGFHLLKVLSDCDSDTCLYFFCFLWSAYQLLALIKVYVSSIILQLPSEAFVSFCSVKTTCIFILCAF